MVRVPLPQQSVEVTRGGTFQAPDVLPQRSAVGPQYEQLGQALTQAGGQIATRAAQLEQTLHVASAKRAQARGEEILVEEDRTFTNLQGEQATGKGRQAADERLRKRLLEVESGLEDDIEKRLYREVMQQRLTALTARWNKHEDEQALVYDVGSRSAVLSSKIEIARREGVDRPPQSLAAVRQEASGLADVRGIQGPAKAEFVRQALTTVHAGTVEDLADAGHGTKAGEYLAQHKNDVDTDTLARLRNVVRRASVKASAIDIVAGVRDDLVAAHRERLRDPDRTALLPADLPAETLLNEGLQRIRAMERAGDITPDERDASFAELRQMASERASVEAQRKTTTAEEAERYIQENRFASPEDLPPSLYQRAKGWGILDDLRRFSEQRGTYSNDEDLYNRIVLANGGGLFQLPPDQFYAFVRTRLDQQHLQEVAALYARANGKETKYAGELTELDLVKEGARKAGILSRNEDEADELRGPAFFNYRQYIRNKARQAGATTPEELQEVINRANKDRVYSTVTGGEARPFGALETEEQTGLDEETLTNMDRGGNLPHERVGAYLTRDLLESYWKRTFPADKLIPDYILGVDEFYLNKIEKEARAAAVDSLQRQGLPVTETAIAVQVLRMENEVPRNVGRRQ